MSFDSYIKPQPSWHGSAVEHCCISFDSYIKPQPEFYSCFQIIGCISFDSYIKPQLAKKHHVCYSVVYLLIPTSNHNLMGKIIIGIELYIF